MLMYQTYTFTCSSQPVPGISNSQSHAIVIKTIHASCSSDPATSGDAIWDSNIVWDTLNRCHFLL